MKRILMCFIVIAALVACSEDKKTAKKPEKPKKEVKTVKQDVRGLKGNGHYKNYKEIGEGEATDEEVVRFNRIIELLSKSSKVEYVFYLPSYSMSTEMENPAQIQQFVAHVSPFDAANIKCDLEAGIAFRDSEGEIHLEMDVVITQAACRYIRTKFDGATHNLGMTENGFQHFYQFLNIKPSDGTPIEK